jgi:hypothetical protein
MQIGLCLHCSINYKTKNAFSISLFFNQAGGGGCMAICNSNHRLWPPSPPPLLVGPMCSLSTNPTAMVA